MRNYKYKVKTSLKYFLSRKRLKICKTCGRLFKPKDKTNNYCNRKCYNVAVSKRMKLNNPMKNPEIAEKLKGEKNGMFGVRLTGELNGNWQGGKIKCECDYCHKEIYVDKKRCKTCKKHFCNAECMGKWRKENWQGENSTRYNANITDEERKNKRQYQLYYDFIKEVYERDNYTCQCCNDDSGGNLNAHHLNGYNWDKEHRTDINNGITLCEECHREFHKIYGYGNNTIKQFKEFLYNKFKQTNDLKYLFLIDEIELRTRRNNPKAS